MASIRTRLRPYSLATCIALALTAVASAAAAQQTVADYEKLAQDKADAMDYDGALAIYDQILQQFPKEFPSIYLERASVRERQMDIAGALADYDSALKVDSPDPAKSELIRSRVQAKRASLRFMVEDYAGAIADYDAALSASPTVSKFKPFEISDMHKERAEARMYSGNSKGALQDYDAALALDAGNSFLLADRGDLKRELRNFDGAIADYTTSIAKAEKPSSLTYEARGIARLCKGDLVGALADLDKTLSLEGALDADVYHGPIVHESNLLIWSLRSRLESKEKADAELSAYLAGAKHSGDPDTDFGIAEYFLGKAPESALLDAIKIPADGKPKDADALKSVALYHIGLKRLVDGDKAGAKQSFGAVLALGEQMHYMDELARAELGRLNPPTPKKK